MLALVKVSSRSIRRMIGLRNHILFRFLGTCCTLEVGVAQLGYRNSHVHWRVVSWGPGLLRDNLSAVDGFLAGRGKSAFRFP